MAGRKRVRAWIAITVLITTFLTLGSLASDISLDARTHGTESSAGSTFPFNLPDGVSLGAREQEFECYEAVGISKEEAELLFAQAEAAIYFPDSGRVCYLTTARILTGAKEWLSRNYPDSFRTSYEKSRLLRTVTVPDFFLAFTGGSRDEKERIFLAKYPIVTFGPPPGSPEGNEPSNAPGPAFGTILQEGFENGLERWERTDSTNGSYTWERTTCSAHTGAYSVDGHRGGTSGSGLTCSSVFPSSIRTYLRDAVCENLQGASQAWMGLSVLLDGSGPTNGNAVVTFRYGNPSNPNQAYGYGYGGGPWPEWFRFMGNLRQWGGWDLATSDCNRLLIEFETRPDTGTGWGVRLDDVLVTTDSPAGLHCGISADTFSGPVPLTVHFTGQAGGGTGDMMFTWYFSPDYTSSREQNPVHTFTVAGRQRASLEVTDSTGAICKATAMIVVGCSPECTAEAVPETGQAPLVVDYNATVDSQNCTSTPTFFWNFGDQTTSTEKAPQHIYTNPGSYNWVMIVTVDGITCQKSGHVIVQEGCTVVCEAAATPSSGVAPLSVGFAADVTLANCHSQPSYDWVFGDGGSSSEQSPTHIYTSPGTYAWSLTVTVDGVTCTRGGEITVTSSNAWIDGKAGVGSGTQFFLLDGPGIVSGTASAKNTATGETLSEPVSAGRFEFRELPLGSYEVWVDITYKDNISYGSVAGDMGCTAPTGGFINKSVTSAHKVVDLNAPVSKQVEIRFPAPVVFLHGILSCYKKWYSADQAAAGYWDNSTRASGCFSFTPGYTWGEDVDWERASAQFSEQVSLDLTGLHAPAALAGWGLVPYALAAHDAGGLVARVLLSGQQSNGAVASSLQKLYLIGVPNSGADQVFGEGEGSPVSVFSVVQRFNEVYPDFGRSSGKVFAIGGTKGLWDLDDGDGRVSLRSAFNISRLECSYAGSGIPGCVSYVSQAFDSSEGHAFDYSHGELGSPPSEGDILDQIIVGNIGIEGSGLPESPAGGIVWGTNSRTVGTAKGSVGASESGAEYPFTVGASDGMAVLAWVTEGSAKFEVVNPVGTFIQDGTGSGWDPGFEFQKLNPMQGQWKLRVTPTSGSATFKALFLEDAPFGIYGYTAREAYPPGGEALLRLDPDGNTADVVFGLASATLFDLSGGVLQNVPLYDDGNHQDGGAGDGRYAGELVAPQAPGSYRLKFDSAGSYAGTGFVRTAEGSLNVVSPGQIFDGRFEFAPVDTDGSGKFDSIKFSAGAALGAAATYVFTGDMFDGDGNFVDHASSMHTAGGPGQVKLDISFSLAGVKCSQVGKAFSVKDIQLSDGATLAPLDIWPVPVVSPVYQSSDFDCSEGAVLPEIAYCSPDEGIRGQTLTLMLSGRNFAEGCGASFGSGVNVGATTRLSGELLSVVATVMPDAAPGMRAAVVTNPGGASGELAGAFEVKDNDPPTALIQTPAAGATLKEVVMVSAAASDDISVTKVDFTVDGAIKATVTRFPFSFEWNTKEVKNGQHELIAVATDGAGLTGASPAVRVTTANTTIPGDCDGDGSVSIGEVQKAINMFLGTLPPACGVDCNGDGKITIGEVQKVINAFLGLPSSC